MRAIGQRSVASVLERLLSVAWYGVVLALLAASFVGLLPLWWDVSSLEAKSHLTMDIPVALRLDAQPLRATAPGLGIAEAEIRNLRAEGALTFPPPSGTFLTLSAFTLVAALALVLWVVTELRNLFRSLREGRPFVSANAKRIRHVGYAVMLAEAGRVAAGFVFGHYAVSHFAAEGVQFLTRPEVNVLLLVEGIMIVVISEVFRVGTRLEEDQAFTV